MPIAAAGRAALLGIDLGTSAVKVVMLGLDGRTLASTSAAYAVQTPLPGWAERAKRAHINMAENLAPFAALVLVAHVTGAANATTAMGAAIF